MYMIFEDKLVVNEEKRQYVGVSYLITEAFRNTDVKVVFAESNAGLKTRLKDLAHNAEEGSPIFVFIDLVADNQNTWGLYSRLVDIACESERAMICVVPVPCIEYCYLNAFHGLLTERHDYEMMMRKEHYTKSAVYKQGFLKANDSSFEKFCKCVRRTYLPYDANKTSFYMEDKSFYNSFLGISNEPLTVIQKGWKVVTMLSVVSTCGSVVYVNSNLVEILDEMYRGFEEQADYYNRIGFSVGNVLRVRKKYEKHKKYLSEKMSTEYV